MNSPPAATSHQDHSAARGALRWLAAETAGWLGTEGERWVFVAKAMLASFSALWLAFRLGLDAPYTALATTVILALPRQRHGAGKGVYTVSSARWSAARPRWRWSRCSPQSPPQLFIGVAAWIALCTGGAAIAPQPAVVQLRAGRLYRLHDRRSRHRRAGPRVHAAVTRVTEVGLGIICAAVVHDVVFPRRHSRTVMRTVEARYASFTAFCAQVLEQRLTPAEAELTHLKFAADIAALESGRAAAFFEADHPRSHTRLLPRLQCRLHDGADHASTRCTGCSTAQAACRPACPSNASSRSTSKRRPN